MTAVEHAQEIVEGLPKSDTRKADEEVSYQKLQELIKKYEDAMEDDFNTADAIAAIFEMVKLSNITVTKESSYAYAKEMLDTIVGLCDVLGIITKKQEEILDSDIEALIEQRQQARKNKDFAKADAIRDELLERGIVLKDTREGVKWSRA